MLKKLIHRKETIIISTIEVLDQVGIKNLSTKLIADQEGVSEGTLFRHFKNKDEILEAVIDHFAQFDDAIIDTCQQRSLSPLNCLRHFFNAYGEYYQNYPEITVIPQLYGALRYEDALLQKIEAINQKRENFIVQMINQAKVEKSIHSEIDSVIIAETMFDIMFGLVLKWRRKNYAFSIKEKLKERLEILLSLLQK